MFKKVCAVIILTASNGPLPPGKSFSAAYPELQKRANTRESKQWPAGVWLNNGSYVMCLWYLDQEEETEAVHVLFMSRSLQMIVVVSVEWGFGRGGR